MKCKDCDGVGKWEYGSGIDDVKICDTCKGTGETVRPSVSWFAKRMEQTLQRNDYKGGWSECQWEYLIDRLREESQELRLALEAGDNVENIIKEATDVSNFAMMIAENAHKAFKNTR